MSNKGSITFTFYDENLKPMVGTSNRQKFRVYGSEAQARVQARRLKPYRILQTVIEPDGDLWSEWIGEL